jgi:N-acetylneuraminate lyase
MDPATSSFKIVGLCAAPFTPMTPTGSVCYESIAKHVEECVAQGVTTVFVNGTTGEGYTMSLPERKAIVEHWVKLSKGRLKVIVMLACEALPEMLELAEHAFDAGVQAVSLQPSVFFKPEGISAIIGLLDLVASHSRGLPLYYYHIPSKTGVNIRCDLLLDAVAGAQAGGRLRTFRGIKYSDPDLHILANCIHSHGGAFDVAYGKDEQMLGALAMGAKGFVGSTYNYSGKASNKVIELFNKGEG